MTKFMAETAAYVKGPGGSQQWFWGQDIAPSVPDVAQAYFIAYNGLPAVGGAYAELQQQQNVAVEQLAKWRFNLTTNYDLVVQAVASAGAIPVILGGDHTVTFPDATGVARHVGWGRVSLIHFDAHADTGDTQFGSLVGHGTPMRRLIESGAVRGDRFLQIGLRGYWPEPPTLAWMAEQRMRSFEMSESWRGVWIPASMKRSRSRSTNATGC